MKKTMEEYRTKQKKLLYRTSQMTLTVQSSSFAQNMGLSERLTLTHSDNLPIRNQQRSENSSKNEKFL